MDVLQSQGEEEPQATSKNTFHYILLRGYF